MRWNTDDLRWNTDALVQPSKVHPQFLRWNIDKMRWNTVRNKWEHQAHGCSSAKFVDVLARMFQRADQRTHKPLFVDIRQDRHYTTVSSTVSQIMDQDPETCILWSHLSSQCLEQSKHNTLFPQRKCRHRKHMVGIRDFVVTIRKYIYLLQ